MGRGASCVGGRTGGGLRVSRCAESWCAVLGAHVHHCSVSSRGQCSDLLKSRQDPDWRPAGLGI